MVADLKAATPRAGGSLDSGAPEVRTLNKRSDFLRASRARREVTHGFIVQARKRNNSEVSGAPIRVGFTCSKKVGNAVARNRAKRRLRALARSVLSVHGEPGWDYVLVGRFEKTAEHDFAAMQSDLRNALQKLHRA